MKLVSTVTVLFFSKKIDICNIHMTPSNIPMLEIIKLYKNTYSLLIYQYYNYFVGFIMRKECH